MTNIAILGANGRMGRTLVEATLDDEHAQLAGAHARSGSEFIGMDAGRLIGREACGCVVSDMSGSTAEICIDFTLPEALEHNLNWCAEQGIAMVIGTTGLDERLLNLIDQTASKIPIVFAPNYSVGVNLMINLLKTAASVMGDYTDIEIIEGHHRFKKDAPSGTAMKFGEVVADTLGRDLKQCAVYGREGIEEERKRETIGFSTIRAADIVGEHTVMFADMGERLEITHKATSRLTFAKGAVRAAKWLKDQPPGLYDMQTVLGL
jgi:4-hydroxy-tetrahydrodipicolinate reductase